MKHAIITIALSALLLTLGAAYAADSKPAAKEEAGKASAGAKTNEGQAAKHSKEAPKADLVDINGASAEELKKLPGITDAEAKKIIAGRPYGSKAHLVTRNIIANDIYEGLKKLVVAKQPNKNAADNAALYAPKSAPKK